MAESSVEVGFDNVMRQPEAWEMSDYPESARGPDFEVGSQRSYDSGLTNLLGHPRDNQNVMHFDNDLPPYGKSSDAGTYYDGRASSMLSSEKFAKAEGSISGSYSASQYGGPVERSYTVERKDEDSHMHRWYKKPSRALSAIKLILALLLMGVTLFCVIASKFTILSIAKRLAKDNEITKYNHANCNSKNLENCEREVSFVMLCLVLMIPPAYTLLKVFLTTCRKITHPWPTKLAILWGAIGTIMEVAGLSLFFVGLVHNVKDTDIILILMNALFIFPVMWQFFKEFQALSSEKEMELSVHLYEKRQRRHKQNVALAVVAFILQVGGIVGIIYLLWGKSTETLIIIPVAIALLSIAWSPKIRKVQIDHDLAYVWSDTSEESLEQSKLPKNHRTRYFRDSKGEEDEFDGAESTLSRSKQKKQKSIGDHARNIIVQTNTSRGKATLINCLIKLLTIPIFVTFFVYLFEVADVTKAVEGFKGITHDKQLLAMFILHIVASFVGYHTAWVGCMITLQRLCFAVPLTLSTPICIGIVLTSKCGFFGVYPCDNHTYDNNGLLVALLSVALWLGQFFATTYYAWKSQDFVMAEEATLFWVPVYDGSLLEQNILLNRKNEATNDYFVNYRSLVKRSNVYICTTMYHEADYEMEQLLYSLAGVDRARRNEGRMFESHIWFDDGVRDKTLKTFAIQLISLLPHTVQVSYEQVTKLDTPYGMQLKWILPGGMPFHIHLKDNFKVKNKKRWSQVMYMSYVLDFREAGNRDYSYILTTDADVKFHPEDVTALMDFMSRDPSVGAVCGRTHPMGSGPLVWYQIFDYAIGHWLLKVAEHVLGSVLCSPGCFSVYRCTALQDILPTYASSVECALDFLTKDMGEDRWLCTLMIERGWRLDYCASSMDSTYCPDTFDEFFKQRRRWGPSTLANQAVMVQTQAQIRRSNDDINLMFVIYQVLMLISTIIGPGTVLLLVSSGLHAAYPRYVNLTEMFVLNLLVVLGYVFICLYFDQNKQLKSAQILTFIYSIIMTITIVGLMIQVADDLDKQRKEGFKYFYYNGTEYGLLPPKNESAVKGCCDKKFVFQFTPPTVFLFFLIGMFTTTAFLHGSEGLQLIHGLWYLLCLPSGYIFLMVYSLVNITDRSWGTRESAVKKNKINTDHMPWYHKLWFKFREVFFCCFKDERARRMPQPTAQPEDEDEVEVEGGDDPPPGRGSKRNSMKKKKEKGSTDEKKSLLAEEEEEAEEMKLNEAKGGGYIDEARGGGYIDDTGASDIISIVSSDAYTTDERRQVRFARNHNRTGRFQSQRRPENMQRHGNFIGEYDFEMGYGNGYNQNGVYIGDADSDISDFYITLNIDDWLDGPYSMYINKFKKAGYDDTTFLMGIKEQELVDIGITNRGHRKKILAEIDRLPPEEIDQDVPEDVHEWLMLLGLEEYWPLFESNSYAEPNALADLKLMDKNTLASTFEIIKPGHLKKLIKAIKQLKYPTSAQRKIRQAKLALERVQTYQLAEEAPEEFMFWDRLRKICLLTEQAAFSQSEELHSKLFELRNSALVVFAVCNILWLSIMLAILNQGEKLTIFNSNFLSVAFLIVYAIIMGMQFVTLLVHRVSTWLHFISRTPFKPGSQTNKAWAFNDEELPPEPSYDELEEAREIIGWNLRRRSQRRTIQAKERAEFFAGGRAHVNEVQF